MVTPHQFHRTAVLYLTHYLDEIIIHQLEKLQKNLSPTLADDSNHEYHLILLYENSRNDLAQHYQTYPFLKTITAWSFTPKLIQRAYPLMQGRYNMTGKDQACSFLAWAVQTEKPAYDFYWCIEYDVRFFGNWLTLFRFYENKFYDILANDIGDRHDGWKHWGPATNKKYHQKKHQVALFMPIIRYSHRTVILLDQQYRSGNVGHCEAIQSCILNEFGYSMKEIKKSFVGYFDYRPVLSVKKYRSIRKANKLYHPVKSKKK